MLWFVMSFEKQLNKIKDMRQLKHLLAAWLIVIGATSLVSSKAVDRNGLGEDPRVQVIKDAGMGAFKVLYESEQEGKVTIKIYDESGNLLHAEVSKNAKSFAKRFYFENLPAGTYTISVSGPDFEFKEKVAYATPAQVELEAELIEVVPGKKYRLSVSGMEDSPVRVRIYDSEGYEIFSGKVDLDNTSGRVFDLAQAATSDVVFIVADKARSVTKTVKLK
jgi:flagellar hook assembly protein FlgD